MQKVRFPAAPCLVLPDASIGAAPVRGGVLARLRAPVPWSRQQRPSGAAVGVRGSDRRRFLGWLIAGLGALGAAAVGVPVIGALGARARPAAKPESWIDFGSIDAVPVGRPSKLVADFEEQDAWYRQRVRRAVWVVRHTAGEVTVFSPRCTHLGCAYRWDEPHQQFACPCHGGTFAITGAVTGGPPPQPLVKLDARIDTGRLRVRFRPGEGA